MTPATAARWYIQLFLRYGEIVRQRNLQAADRAMSIYPWLTAAVLGRELLFSGDSFGLAREMYGRLVYFLPPGLSHQSW